MSMSLSDLSRAISLTETQARNAEEFARAHRGHDFGFALMTHVGDIPCMRPFVTVIVACGTCKDGDGQPVGREL